MQIDMLLGFVNPVAQHSKISDKKNVSGKTDDDLPIVVHGFSDDLKERPFVATNDSSEVIVAAINTETTMMMKQNAEPRLLTLSKEHSQASASQRGKNRSSSKSKK